ncbi:MAG: hypothetical protein JST80_05315 [Bdellovibrionales bacterium]|nr:hypothetical protein [Bdellovibrionales bacterium]
MRVFLATFLALSFSGCGYHLRGNTREFFNDHHIQTIYVAPARNNSFKAGVEITLYNALRKKIALGGYVKIVDSPNDADARIASAIQDAAYSPYATAGVQSLSPTSTALDRPGDLYVASLYEAKLRVQFKLSDRRDTTLWSDELTRTKRFSASTFFGGQGSTSALINESEFERTLSDLFVSIVTDAEESINTAF